MREGVSLYWRGSQLYQQQWCNSRAPINHNSQAGVVCLFIRSISPGFHFHSSLSFLHQFTQQHSPKMPEFDPNIFYQTHTSHICGVITCAFKLKSEYLVVGNDRSGGGTSEQRRPECSALTRAREENKQLHKWWSGQRKTEKGSHRWLALPMATQCPLSRLCVFSLPKCFFFFFSLTCVQNWVSHILSKYIFQSMILLSSVSVWHKIMTSACDWKWQQLLFLFISK